MHRPKHIVEYLLLRVVAGLFRILPLRMALAVMWCLAAFMHFVVRFRVKQAHARLHEVFGSTMTDRDIRRVAWIAWRNICFNAVEITRLRGMTLADAQRVYMNHQEITNLAARTEEGQGGLMAVPHAGNWDMAGTAVQLHGFPMFVLARPQSNPLTDRFLNQMRGAQGIAAVMNDSSTLKSIIRRLKQGEWMAILPDVRAKQLAIRVNYLNGVANIGGGMALFARMAGVPIQLAFCMREGWTRHRFIKGDVIESNPSLSKDEDLHCMTQQVMSFFDENVRRYPEQYFWYNKRWVLDPLQESVSRAHTT